MSALEPTTTSNVKTEEKPQQTVPASTPQNQSAQAVDKSQPIAAATTTTPPSSASTSFPNYEDPQYAAHTQHHRHHAKKPVAPSNREEEEEEYSESEEQANDYDGDDVRMPMRSKRASNQYPIASPISSNPCHEMQMGDCISSMFCPCIVYGQVLNKLDPSSSAVAEARPKRGSTRDKRKKSTCHVSAGCLMWNGMICLTAGAIQTLLSVPNVCGWMPTTFLGDFFDVREFFLAAAYCVPQCLCLFPLRVAVAEGEENPCVSCMISTFCSCCSLSSMKEWVKTKGVKFTEDSIGAGKFCPCCGVIMTVDEEEDGFKKDQGSPRYGDDSSGEEGGRPPVVRSRIPFFIPADPSAGVYYSTPPSYYNHDYSADDERFYFHSQRASNSMLFF